MRSRSFPLVVAAAAVVLAAAVYAIAIGTATGRELDEAALLRGFDGPGWPRVRFATQDLVTSVSQVSLALAGLGVAGIALLRRRLDVALAALLLIAGANLTTQFLKPFLGIWDPLGGEDLRARSNAFPSGHATVAMSLALAAVLAAPAALRPAVGLVVAAFPAAMGIGLMGLGWHFPSDVAGGFLIAAAWTALAAAWLARRSGEAVRPPGWAWPVAGALAAVAAVGVAAMVALAIDRRPELIWYGQLRTGFLVGAIAIGLFGVALPVVAARLLSPPDSEPPRPAG